MHIKDDVINYQLSTGWLIFDHSLLLSKVTSRLLAHHSLQDLFFGTSVEHAHTHQKKRGTCILSHEGSSHFFKTEPTTKTSNFFVLLIRSFGAPPRLGEFLRKKTPAEGHEYSTWNPAQIRLKIIGSLGHGAKCKTKQVGCEVFMVESHGSPGSWKA